MRCRMVVSLMLATTAVATAQTPGRFAMALAVDRLVRTYRVGAPSIRRGGETWEQLERRLRTLAPGDFPASVRKADTSLARSILPRVPHSSACCARRAGRAIGCG